MARSLASCHAALGAVALRLQPVAAQLHRAPRRRPVLRLVEEDPVAVAASLQPLPRPVARCIVDDCEQPGEEGIDAAAERNELAARERDAERRALRLALESRPVCVIELAEQQLVQSRADAVDARQ